MINRQQYFLKLDVASLWRQRDVLQNTINIYYSTLFFFDVFMLI